MEIDRYFEVSDDQILFTRQQSSDFAKHVAGDFNPLHDIEAKRFCVPGDLLFAVYLSRHGLFESMTFDFLTMVDATVPVLEEKRSELVVLIDKNDREFLTIRSSGEHTRADAVINGLTEAYVKFSGQTFPYLLVDLMRQHNVMINPARPLVIYKSMEIEMTRLDIADISLKFSGAGFVRDGKKASVDLNFDIYASEQHVGKGLKQMVLGGLREFDEQKMEALVSEYQQIKARHSES